MPPPTKLADALRGISTATLAEVGAGFVESPPRPLATPAYLCGPALPVSIPSGDNLSVHHAIARADRGAVLVVRCEGGPTHGFWGEIATIAAISRGVAGLVTDGAVRDTDAIRALGFPLFAGGIQIRGTVKRKRGTVGEPISLGGVEVREGDLIVADSDGVAVVRPEAAAGIVEAARARDEKEKRIMAALREGKTTIELLGLPGEDK